MKCILGELTLTSEQAQRLALKPRSQLSPMLERCCLRVSANASYHHACKDVELFTGMRVSAKTQQRLVQRYDFPLPAPTEGVHEVSLDGGMVRLVPPAGVKLEKPLWQQYKAVCLDPQGHRGAWFNDNTALLAWVKDHPFNDPVYCLGDGHDGIWNVLTQIATKEQRKEILDWYHLMENLEKIPNASEAIAQARSLLWQGKVEETLALFQGVPDHQAQCFCEYLQKHRHRIPNYDYLQAEGICSIGSGAVESTVKQIDRRLQISGARWQPNHVPQVLAHRCAYLNDLL